MKDDFVLTQRNIEKLLVDLRRAREQIFNLDTGGKAWICPAISRAIIYITLFEDRIQELKIRKDYLEAEVEDLKTGIVD